MPFAIPQKATAMFKRAGKGVFVSSEMFTYEQESELRKEIHALIKMGLDFPPILRALQKKFDFVRDKSQKLTTDFIDTVIDGYRPFAYVQKIKKSSIIAATNSKVWYLYDNETKSKEPVLESTIRTNCKFDWVANMQPSILEYLPHTKADIIPTENGTYKFNTYIPANWYREYHYQSAKVVAGVDLPDIYNTFFGHLFKGDESSIKYVLDWMANGLKRKNQCYLVTIGAAGTGKTTLGDIFQALVGENNYTHIAFKSITKQFNSTIKDKLIIYFDEVRVSTNEQEDLLKMLVNPKLEVELKNIDSQVVQNFASVYLSSNRLDSLKMEADDRRFSITELTDIPFKDVFPADFRDKLFEPENISQLGLYLLNREVNTDEMRTPFISKRTELARQSSLKEWEDYFLFTIAHDFAGKTKPISELCLKVQTETDNMRNRVTAKGLQKLNSMYPSFYSLRRETASNRKLWMVTFKSLDEQPRHLLDNVEVSTEE